MSQDLQSSRGGSPRQESFKRSPKQQYSESHDFPEVGMSYQNLNYQTNKMNDILETGKSTSLADNQVHQTFINKFGKIALES